MEFSVLPSALLLMDYCVNVRDLQNLIDVVIVVVFVVVVSSSVYR